MNSIFGKKSESFRKATVVKYLGDNMYLVVFLDNTNKRVYSTNLWRDGAAVTVYGDEIMGRARTSINTKSYQV